MPIANRSALKLFGVEQPEDVIGTALDTCVAAEDSTALAGFVLRVCGGESGSLECQLVGSDGTRRVVEIRAVPLRRTGTTVFLGATWDVSEQQGLAGALQEAQARCELLAAQHGASEHAFRETNEAHEQLRREHQDLAQSHQGLAESLDRAQHQLQTALAEAHVRQEEMTAQGTAQLVMERTTQQGALERMERQYQASLEALTAEGQQIERALADLRARSRDESEYVAAAVCELEHRCKQLTDNSHAVREVLEGAVQAERECYAVLSDAQTQWQTKLAKAWGALGDASARTERALDSSQRRRPLTERPSQNTDGQLPSDDSPTAASEPDENSQTERGTTNAGEIFPRLTTSPRSGR